VSKVDLRLQCGMPCSKLEVSTAQHGTLSGAGYLHQSPRHRGRRCGGRRVRARHGHEARRVRSRFGAPMPPRQFGDKVVSVLDDPKYAEGFAFGLKGDTGVTMLEAAAA
jgi:hypothetical protein